MLVGVMGHSYRRDRKDADHDVVVAQLRAIGAEVHYIGRPLDLLVGIMGVTLLCEVKSLDEKGRPGKLKPEQAALIARWPGSPVLLLTRDTATARVLEEVSRLTGRPPCRNTPQSPPSSAGKT
jgi:hypothetical protein